MAMTIVVTRNVPDRFRGFLASCMCEIAPGVYTAPRMNPGIRDRVWAIMTEWFREGAETSVLMTWPAPKRTGGQEIRVLGTPRTELCDHDGVFLSRRDPSERQLQRLDRIGD